MRYMLGVCPEPKKKTVCEYLAVRYMRTVVVVIYINDNCVVTTHSIPYTLNTVHIHLFVFHNNCSNYTL